MRIHEDCGGDDGTCQRTRAGDVYNGSPSIYDWFARSPLAPTVRIRVTDPTPALRDQRLWRGAADAAHGAAQP